MTTVRGSRVVPLRDVEKERAFAHMATQGGGDPRGCVIPDVCSVLHIKGTRGEDATMLDFYFPRSTSTSSSAHYATEGGFVALQRSDLSHRRLMHNSTELRHSENSVFDFIGGRNSYFSTLACFIPD